MKLDFRVKRFSIENMEARVNIHRFDTQFMTEFPIPTRASEEDLKDILKAYYIEGAHTEAVSTDVVEDTADMGDRVGRQTRFLVDVGLLSKEGRKRKLTEDGESVSEALMGGNESLAKSLMREVLNEWDFTDKIKGFVRMQEPEPVQTDRLVEYILANAAQSDNRGASTLIDLLVWTDILEEKEEGYVLSESHADGVEEKEDQEEGEGETYSVTASETVSTSTSQNHSMGANDAFSIEIEITPSDDPGEVKNVITAVREALSKDLEEDDE